MPELHLRISPVFLTTFRELVEGFVRHVGVQLSVQPQGPDPEDEDMMDAWREGLLASVRDDCAQLMALMKDSGLGREKVVLEEENALAVIRACSAVRLKIQQLFLKPYGEEQLEEGELDFDEMGPELQQVYACYVFLAGLQELLVHEVDPDATRG